MRSGSGSWIKTFTKSILNFSKLCAASDNAALLQFNHILKSFFIGHIKKIAQDKRQGLPKIGAVPKVALSSSKQSCGCYVTNLCDGRKNSLCILGHALEF